MDWLVTSYVNDFIARGELGGEWTSYHRVQNDLLDTYLESAAEAGRQVDPAITVDVVPDDYAGASVKRLPGTTVFRIANVAVPWS